jgi:hypothetical protein
MTTVYVSCTPTAVDADGVCASQSPGAGAILINGALAASGVVTLGAAQLIRLTSAGNTSGITFTFNGTDADGNAQSQTVAGTNAGNTDTTLYFKTITSIVPSGSVTGAIVVGNLITSVSRTYRPNVQVNPFNVNLYAQLMSGTATFYMDYTFDDTALYPTTWIADGTITNKSASFEGAWTKPIAGMRLRLTASSSGNVHLKSIQAGV